MIGTCASCSVSGVSPPSLVVPQPTIVSSVAGAQSDAFARARDLRRRLRRRLRELQQRDVVARVDEVVGLDDRAADRNLLALAGLVGPDAHVDQRRGPGRRRGDRGAGDRAAVTGGEHPRRGDERAGAEERLAERDLGDGGIGAGGGVMAADDRERGGCRRAERGAGDGEGGEESAHVCCNARAREIWREEAHRPGRPRQWSLERPSGPPEWSPGARPRSGPCGGPHGPRRVRCGARSCARSRSSTRPPCRRPARSRSSRGPGRR